MAMLRDVNLEVRYTDRLALARAWHVTIRTPTPAIGSTTTNILQDVFAASMIYQIEDQSDESISRWHSRVREGVLSVELEPLSVKERTTASDKGHSKIQVCFLCCMFNLHDKYKERIVRLLLLCTATF